MNLKELKLTERRQKICHSLDLNDEYDILAYYPSRYEFYEVLAFSLWKESETVVFRAKVLTYPSSYRPRRNLLITTFDVLYDEEELKLTIFNRPWLRLQVGEMVSFIGTYNGKNKVTVTNYSNKAIDEIAGIQPIYPLKEGITQNDIKKIISFVYEKCEDSLNETIPQRFIEKHHLITYQEAIKNIHFPTNRNDLLKAIARLKYEEFFNFFALLKLHKENNLQMKIAKKFDYNQVLAFINKFPFELTTDQKETINDILNDLASPYVMHRLVQGDVGCGKTAVSEVALYAAYLAGYQAAFMAPTEILAHQHFLSLKEVFENENIKVACLTSSSKDNKAIKEELKKGEIDILVGTHAIFQDDVIYANLGLVITDEQHRFGVNQRRALNAKGNHPDYLLMSATPIPRTLASSIYGDLDVSTIVSMPKGRKGCDTMLIKTNSIKPIINELFDLLKEGRQLYIIGSLIEANEEYNAIDVTGLYEVLKEKFKPYKVALLHGQMKSEEKEIIMKAFMNNDIQVLISTTVVEVGVNVKNATAMVIYNAERFGLSQLHQLRGRIQRSSYKGKLYLLTASKDSDTLNRLNVLVNTNDGFKVAEEDLYQRGPGDLLGTRQSGLPSFHLGNLIKDTKIIEASKEDVIDLMKSDDEIDKAYIAKLLTKVRKGND